MCNLPAVLARLLNKKNQNLSPSNGINRNKQSHILEIIDQDKQQVLILVINSLKKDFVESLETQGKIEAQDCDQLYRATQTLWLGNKESDSSNLNYRFENPKQFVVQQQEDSEYDVYLIKIELDDPHPGFKPNVNQIERMSAFRTLAGSSVEISLRLTVEVFIDTGVYNC
ncbi:hypothetical protein [Dolichospermum sp. UHCC 0259]|uniref:hypothetical protein n=1 Tax=Dolichospermum sp. UHCC 0259 TaxID=2590010 RepID=UPI00144707C4|nr:hypothetical protein [Dolichospermum sp. UHCC 0259]MTJ47348.1 hypothetical protein [Dolichospermum sp. UHCC 0259]